MNCCHEQRRRTHVVVYIQSSLGEQTTWGHPIHSTTLELVDIQIYHLQKVLVLLLKTNIFGEVDIDSS